jgi:predicted chitinase
MDLNLGDTQLIIKEASNKGLLRNQLAYVLATAYHETAHTMKPVREYGGEKYLKSKKYYPYVGMGYVQLTWDYNYKRASEELGVDFLSNPKLLLDPKYATPILILGMIEGWFTGKKLSDYITFNKSDYVNARRIINGVDKKELIAGYAEQYDKLLLDSGYGVEQPQKPVQSVPDNQATSTAPWWLKLLLALLRGGK